MSGADLHTLLNQSYGIHDSALTVAFLLHPGCRCASHSSGNPKHLIFVGRFLRVPFLGVVYIRHQMDTEAHFGSVPLPLTSISWFLRILTTRWMTIPINPKKKPHRVTLSDFSLDSNPALLLLGECKSTHSQVEPWTHILWMVAKSISHHRTQKPNRMNETSSRKYIPRAVLVSFPRTLVHRGARADFATTEGSGLINVPFGP